MKLKLMKLKFIYKKFQINKKLMCKQKLFYKVIKE